MAAGPGKWSAGIVPAGWTELGLLPALSSAEVVAAGVTAAAVWRCRRLLSAVGWGAGG